MEHGGRVGAVPSSMARPDLMMGMSEILLGVMVSTGYEYPSGDESCSGGDVVSGWRVVYTVQPMHLPSHPS